ncbi:Divalent metal cation transporter MntH [Rubrobacter xylanophilus DSM 9941]|uniref:Nramp family divalent metal transporter n=1 Tax=Rubrobacter xylanophilus TaxID=49319 RepID=UPI001C63FA43|nr:Nramp family divalent metal transporter [Rubrobacter xylanophilus]QYJ16854.1 Divalent metal cation transporter MntH [Rubrobacter xylanophilus DSM 9941]
MDEESIAEAARAALEGRRRGLGRVWPFLGPAFVAAVAYVDPGNFATNISAGARFGYMLLWVILVSNLMAMLIQVMSAKLGIATGRNLPELCRAHFPGPVSVLLWVQAEVVAMATDLAEFIGAALALNLLFGLPLLPAGLLTGVVAFGILALQRRGFRPFEAVITAMVGVIVAAFVFQMFYAGPEGGRILAGLFTPRFAGPGSVLLATGILGATVMPHVIYLHSALTQGRVTGRTEEEKRRIFRFEVVDVIIAMGLAGVINGSMLIMAAALFHANGLVRVADIDRVFEQLRVLVGDDAALLFGVALLASGLSSSSVGTMSGQVVMQGFINRRIPLFLRRAITMAPALIVISTGVNPSYALVVSQVILSFGIPFALIPLLIFCRNHHIMGSLVNHRPTTAIAAGVIALVVMLNALLLYQTFFA